MSKKKISDEVLLKHNLIIRVNDNLHQKLVKLLAESDCQSIAEVARKILTNQKINCFYKDISLNAPMEEMALIRKELKAIGVNINQQTLYFNACKTDAEKRYHAEQTLALYQRVEEKVERLFELISKLAEKWLPRS
jgi:hypothetical protein